MTVIYTYAQIECKTAQMDVIELRQEIVRRIDREKQLEEVISKAKHAAASDIDAIKRLPCGW